MKKQILIPATLFASILLFAAPAWAFPTERDLPAADILTLSAAAPDDNLSGLDRPFIAVDAYARTANVIGRLPPALFDIETNRLTALSFSFAFEAADAPSAPIVLYALTNAYDPAASTWNLRAGTNAWRYPGGDAIARQAVTAAVERATFAVPSATTDVYVATFNIFPLFFRDKQGPPFRENGFLLAFAPDGADAARIVLFSAAPGTPADALPAVRAVWCDAFLSLRDYAISGISNGSFHKFPDATDETVYWEQDLTTVGRVMLQTNGFESRAILSMPKSLLPIDPDRIQSVECHFQCYNNTWHGEDLILRPVTSPTRLEMAGKRPDNGDNPDHGPSWRWADGPVDPADADYPRLPWNTPGGDVSPKYAVHALLSNPNGTFVQNISFYLTPLWRDPESRALLAANGAIIAADRSTWDSNDWVAVQIYCSDDYTVAYKSANSTFRVTLYPPFAPPSGEPAAAYALLAEATPDTPAPVLADSPLPTLVGPSPDATETRLAIRFDPSLFAQDPRQADDIRLWFPLDTPPAPAALARLVLHPLAAPFDPETATWNTIGDAFLPDALSAVLSEYKTGLFFDLAPLLADAATSNALAANGALIRILPEPEPDHDLQPAPATRDAAPDAPTIAFSATEPPLLLVIAAPLTLRNPAATPSTLSFDAYGLDPAETYALEASPSLTAPDWQPVLSPIPSDTLTIPFTPTNPTLFFRLRRLPQP